MLTHSLTVLILGIFLFIGGGLLRYFVGRNRFNRVNAFGVQGFRNYERKTFTVFFEMILRVIGLLSMLAGIFLMLLWWYNHHNETKFKEQQQLEKSTK